MPKSPPAINVTFEETFDVPGPSYWHGIRLVLARSCHVAGRAACRGGSRAYLAFGKQASAAMAVWPVADRVRPVGDARHSRRALERVPTRVDSLHATERQSVEFVPHIAAAER